MLVLLLKGLLEECYNPVIIEFAISRAARMANPVMDPVEAERICQELIRAAKCRPNFLDPLFS